MTDAQIAREEADDAFYTRACGELDRMEIEVPVRLPDLDGNCTPRTRAQRLRSAWDEYGGSPGEEDEGLLAAILAD